MRWLYLLLLFTFIGCSVDELPPCEGDGTEGAICKEYQYVYGNYNGLNEYEYDKDGRLISKITKRKNGSEEGSTNYDYDSVGRVISIDLKASNGNLLTSQVFKYDAVRILKEEVTGQLNQTTQYIYSNNVLIAQENYKEGELESIDSLEYYSGTSVLYRVLNYEQGVLTQILLIESFSNNTEKRSYLNANGVLKSSNVRRFDELGNLIEDLDYNSIGDVVLRILYSYNQNQLDQITRFNESDEEFERIEYQRY